MSGLFRFFRAFIPSDNPITEDVIDEGDQGNRELHEGAAEYRESINSIASSLPSVEAKMLGLGMDDFSDDEGGTFNPYKQWKLQRNRLLTDYSVKRFATDPVTLDDEDEDDDEQNDADAEHGEDTQDPDSQGLETQQSDVLQPDAFLDSLLKPHRKKKTIPHMNDTLNHINTVSNLDLYTKSLSLNLCRVERVWKFRETRRLENFTATKVIPRQLDTSTLLPFFPFGHSEDDGPLQTVFKTVVSMEVSQLDNPDKEKIRQSLMAFANAKVYRRVKIFFHDKFADAVQAFLDKSSHTEQLMISLDKIPAKCIFPYHVNQESFHDQDIANYCIVVGDKSSLKLVSSGGSCCKIVFYNEDMEIQLGIWDNTGKYMGMILNQSTINDPEHKGDESMWTIQKRYDNWYHLHQTHQQKATQQQNSAKAIDKPVPGPPVTGVAAPSVAGNTQPGDETNIGRRPKRLKMSMTYHKLNELKDMHDNQMDSKFLSVNVISIVLGFGVPSFTKRNQWMVSLSIVDDSLPLPTMTGQSHGVESTDNELAAITVCVFANNREDLPDVRQAGDILRLKCVGVQVYNNQIQLLASTGRGSSLVVIRPKDTQHPIGRWQFDSTSEISLEAKEVDHLQQLWKWGQARFLSHPTTRVSTRFRIADFGLVEINANTGLQDSVVMVASMFESCLVGCVRDYTLPRGFLRIWDGTGASQSDKFPIEYSNNMFCQNEPPSAVIGDLARIIREMEEGKEHPMEPPKSLCGKVINLAIWEDQHWDLVQKTLCPGKFIRLRNISQGQLNNGLDVLFAQSKSWITPVPDKTFEAIQLLRDHNDRILHQDPFNPQCGVLPMGKDEVKAALQAIATTTLFVQTVQTRDGEPNIEFVQQQQVSERPIMDTLTQCIYDHTLKTFSVSFRITKLSPARNDVIGLGGMCAKSKDGKMRYKFVVHVQDDKEEIGAIAGDTVGLELFSMDANTACNYDPSKACEIIESIQVPDCWWTGIIQSMELKGEKFFVLQSILKCQEASV